MFSFGISTCIHDKLVQYLLVNGKIKEKSLMLIKGETEIVFKSRRCYYI